MVKIIPSIASADQLNLKHEIDRLGSIRSIHIDIEDGNFIPNITFGLRTIKSIAAYSKASLDAHLMVSNPSRYVDDLCACGVKHITTQIEAITYPLDMINRVKAKGATAGLALNLKTSIYELEPFLNDLDSVLIMTSEPDYYDQRFLEYSLAKIAACRKFLPPHIKVWVDGGIGKDQFEKVVQSGADVIIMGRALFEAENPEMQLQKFESSVNNF